MGLAVMVVAKVIAIFALFFFVSFLLKNVRWIIDRIWAVYRYWTFSPKTESLLGQSGSDMDALSEARLRSNR